jgi:hypothetical protein
MYQIQMVQQKVKPFDTGNEEYYLMGCCAM